MPAIPVVRSPLRLRPDPTRLITKPYLSDHGTAEGLARNQRVIQRVLGLTPADVRKTLGELRVSFGGRHGDLDGVFRRGFAAVGHLVPDAAALSDDMRLLVGSYFMHEYSLEGAALTNPSIVAAPDQSEASPGTVRVIVSVRAVGEGHLSSIEFRTGYVGPTGNIHLDPAGVPVTGHRRAPMFDRELFIAKLEEMGAVDDLVRRTLGGLDERFTMANLDDALASLAQEEAPSTAAQHLIQVIHWLAASNYELTFPDESALPQRVLFPDGPTESRGMEDARLVRFVAPDGSAVYYATYTAFDGFNILPQLIETRDFQTFRIATLNGRAARNKGMAIFPRRVGGYFAALARYDGESNYFMRSDNVRFWHDAEQIQFPAARWELTQIGNAGSPMETEVGWLMITHGVGPMRRYALGAMLLDIDDPTHVIGQLREPLLEPGETERDGYVPNVVYSCGSLIHDGRLVITYGASDTFTRFASLEVDALLTELTRS